MDTWLLLILVLGFAAVLVGLVFSLVWSSVKSQPRDRRSIDDAMRTLDGQFTSTDYLPGDVKRVVEVLHSLSEAKQSQYVELMIGLSKAGFLRGRNLMMEACDALLPQTTPTSPPSETE
jgi:hypothetical protein